MKKILILNILGIFISLLLFISCSEKQIDGFDANECFINFEKHIHKDMNGEIHEITDKEYEYSFSLEDESFKSYDYKFVVIIVGAAVGYDRPYTINVIEEKTTAPASIYAYESNRILKAGEVTDTVNVTLYRDPMLKDDAKVLTLGLVANEHFKKGVEHRQYVSLTFADKLLKPDWWNLPIYSRYFGAYYEEVYRKWMEIYYLGFDKKLGDDKSPFYWNNMPPGQVSRSSHPTLFAAIDMLKRYFFENDIYPNGDTSLPPIKLP